VAEAAAGAWGPGWLPSTGMTVSAAGRVLTAAMGHSTPRVAETVAPISLRETPGPAEADPVGDLVPVTELEAELTEAQKAPTYEEARPAPTDRQTGAPARQTVDAPAVLTPTVPGPGDAGGGAGATIAPSAPPPATPPPPSPSPPSPAAPTPARRRRWPASVGVAVLIVVALLAVVFVIRHRPIRMRAIVTVPGNQAWIDTRLAILPHDRIVILASGTVNPAVELKTATGQPQFLAGPDGVPGNTAIEVHDVLANLHHSGLIGRIGATGKPFNVGSHLVTTGAKLGAGELFLGINDQGVANNSGAFHAIVAIRRPRR